ARMHASWIPHPDPLPIRKGEGNLLWHGVRVTEQGSKTRAFELYSPRSERGRIKVRGASDCVLTAEAGSAFGAKPIHRPFCCLSYLLLVRFSHFHHSRS